MTKLEQIERSIAALSPKELNAFAKWFEAFQADVWDKQIEADAKAGRLDGFAKKALAEIRAIMGSGKRFYHAAPNTGPPPPNEAVVASGVWAKRRWQITPGCS